MSKHIIALVSCAMLVLDASMAWADGDSRGGRSHERSYGDGSRGRSHAHSHRLGFDHRPYRGAYERHDRDFGYGYGYPVAPYRDGYYPYRIYSPPVPRYYVPRTLPFPTTAIGSTTHRYTSRRTRTRPRRR